MAIYKLSAQVDDDYGSLVLTTELSHFNEYRFSGKPAGNWKPITLQWSVNKCTGKPPSKINDVVHVFGAGLDIAVNEKAKCIFAPALGDAAEFLPVTVIGDQENNWYIINVINVINNALDENKSKFKTLRSGERGPAKKVVFDDSNIPDNNVFVYPHTYSNLMLKGDLLKKSIEDSVITGVEFKKCITNSDTLSKAC